MTSLTLSRTPDRGVDPDVDLIVDSCSSQLVVCGPFLEAHGFGML